MAGGGSLRAETYDLATGRRADADAVDAEGSTATPLPDGRVLIAGGCDRERRAAAALYDPVTGRWRTTGRPRTARDGHTATLLPDGTVLVAGGQPCGHDDTYLATAERYDPATGAWSAAGTMADPRANHTATLLHDGAVLVAGGINLSNGSGVALTTSSAELYLPAGRAGRAAP